MALGKNLKRTKLISDDSEKKKPKKVKRKALIKSEKTTTKSKKSVQSSNTKSSSKKAKAPLKPKTKVQSKKPTKKTELKESVLETRQAPKEVGYQIDPVLSNYIANELRERKLKLRKQYAEEINALKETNIQLVNFKLNDELYAVDIHIIKEIVKLPQLSKTPNTPKHIKGLANVRGVSYTVFDLASRFGLAEIVEPQYLMIFNHNQVKASLILEALPTTFKVEGKSISADIQMIEDATLDLSYIKGIVNHNDALIYYLDIIEMLKNDKAVVIPDELKK
ncbi:chemotaxis protein CheW [Ekhidna sp.]|uniref:chemotaxis protein CheW n=1 Tax=Ekhidna sp. TaxID=2608089 RepID=UPI003B501967